MTPALRQTEGLLPRWARVSDPALPTTEGLLPRWARVSDPALPTTEGLLPRWARVSDPALPTTEGLQILANVGRGSPTPPSVRPKVSPPPFSPPSVGQGSLTFLNR